MNELLKEAFHTYQLYLTTSGVLDNHQAKLGVLKWPDVAQSAIALADAIENKSTNIETIRAVLKKDLSIATLEPVKALFQSVIVRAAEIAGDGIGKDMLDAVKEDGETDPIKLKNAYIGRINSLFDILERKTNKKYPKLKTQTETPVKTKDVA